MKGKRASMLTRSLTAIATIAACSLAWRQSGAQLDPRSYVYTDKNALLLMPSTRVSDDTYNITWSPDSVRLMTFNIHRVDPEINLDPDNHIAPESDLEIGRWNRVSHYADVVWKRRYSTEPVLSGDPTWIPNTQYLTQMVFWQEKNTVPDAKGGTRTDLNPNQELLWINAARSSVHEIPMAQGDRLEVSPSRSLAVIISQSFAFPNNPAMLTPVRVDGALGTPLQLPIHQTVFQTNWTSDGRYLLLSLIGMGDIGKGSIKTYASYDPVSGEIKPLKSAPDQSQIGRPLASPQHEVVLEPSIQHLRDTGLDVVTHPLWAQTGVKSEKPIMLVCSDADLGVVSPDGSTIAYRAQRSSWVADIKFIPIDEFKALLAKAMRLVAISNAKQLGLAAIMWAEDHNQTLPSPGNINTELMPYLQTDALFDQFTYTYPGGPLAAIASPAETILGTVDGPGGQAVIYSDGHVKWQNR